MNERNEDEREKLNVSQRLTFERLSPTRLEAEPAPDAMSIEMLVAKYLREIVNAYGGDSSTDEKCVELLGGADQDNAQIWELVLQSLREKIRGWMELHPYKTAAASLDSEENYIARTFAKLSEISASKRIRLSQLSDMLKYLQASLNGVILDSLRPYNAPLCEIDPPPSDTAESAAAQSDNGEVWEILSKLLPDVREQRIAYLLFHCGLRPKDIVHTFPEEFKDVREISLLRCNVNRRMLDYVDQHDRTIRSKSNWNVNSNKARD